MVGKLNTNGNTTYNMGEEYGRIKNLLVIAGGKWSNDLCAIRNSELAILSLTLLEAIVRMFPNEGLHFAKVIANCVHKKKVIDTHNSSNFLHIYALDIAIVAIVHLQPSSMNEEGLAKLSEVMGENLGKIAPC